MIEKIKDLLPENQIVKGDSIEAKLFLQERRGNFQSQCEMIVMPKTALEVSRIVKLCHENNISIVSQSGNTGLVGGSVAERKQIIISSKLMNSVIEFDIDNFSISVESGVVLSHIENIVGQQDLIFPLNLPSKNECCIGGLIATNAGGVGVIKYGNIRSLILGLEVVLPNGKIFSDLNKLRKRNIGTDIKQLFIGSEGTLGFITKACLKLFPRAKNTTHLLVAVKSVEEAQCLFKNIYKDFSSLISAFETFNHNALLLSEIYNQEKLNIQASPWYIIMSFDMKQELINMQEYLKRINKDKNQYIVTSDNTIWKYRYSIPKAQSLYGPSLKHDISVPIAKIKNFISKSLKDLNSKYDDKIMPIIFGHMGDGNLHFNISKNKNYEGDLFLLKEEIKNLLVKNAMELGGTFSAEHGIGLIHKKEFKNYYLDNNYTEFYNLKKYLDNKNIFNPNKIVD